MTLVIRNFFVFLFFNMSFLSPLVYTEEGKIIHEIPRAIVEPLQHIQKHLHFPQQKSPLLFSSSKWHKKHDLYRKKVLFILPHYLGGGMGTAFTALLNNFPDPTAQIDICVLRKRGSRYNGITRKNIRYIPFSKAKEKKYTTVVSYAQWTSPFLWLDTIKAKKRVQWIHNDGSDTIWKRHLLKNKDVMKKIDAYGLVSEASKQNFARFFPKYAKRIHGIYNIIDNAHIKKSSHSTQYTIVPQKKLLNVVTVGRFVYNKNLDTAIKVHACLEKKGVHFRWYLIGYGEEEKNLRLLIKKNGLEKKFIILGFKENPYPYIKAADIFVHIPRIEGFGLVVTEAKILQRPILVSNFPAAYEQIQDGKTGLIVKNTLHAICTGLEKLLLDETLRDRLSQSLKGFTFDNKEVKKELERIFFEPRSN